LSQLLPSPGSLGERESRRNLYDVFGLEAASVSREDLNTYTLCKLAGVRIHWTTNLCRHLILTKVAGKDTLDIFSLPSMFSSHVPKSIGLDTQLLQEIQDSYSSLFNPFESCHESQLSKLLYQDRWCWCHYCLSKRISHEEVRKLKDLMKVDYSGMYDSTIEGYIHAAATDWDIDTFQYLWPRINILAEFLHEAKPWSFWVLFRDRRDTLQYWTFL